MRNAIGVGYNRNTESSDLEISHSLVCTAFKGKQCLAEVALTR